MIQSTLLQVGNVVQDIVSGEKMTIVDISPDPNFFGDIYHCAWFNSKHHVQEAIFLHSEIEPNVISDSMDQDRIQPQIKINDRVILRHQHILESPVMTIIDIFDNQSHPSAICKWQIVDGSTETDIFPFVALQKTEKIGSLDN